MKRLLTVFLVLMAVLAFGQSDGRASKLGAANLAKLRRIKMRFLVPTYVPAGYKVTSFTIEKPKDPVLLTWSATYRNPKTKGEFIVQMCSEGIGDIFFGLPHGDTAEATGEVSYASKVFGKGAIEVYVKGKERQWHLNWVELRSRPKFVSIIGQNMSGAEGKHIVESLRWLK